MARPSSHHVTRIGPQEPVECSYTVLLSDRDSPWFAA